MTSLWRHLWLNYDTLDFKISTQCVKMLGERVLQVWRWYLHRFRRYRKKTRGGARNSPPPSGARVKVGSLCCGRVSLRASNERLFWTHFFRLTPCRTRFRALWLRSGLSKFIISVISSELDLFVPYTQSCICILFYVRTCIFSLRRRA